MLVLAHRGLHRDRPENTMASFEAAVVADVDGIETDVRLTRDGVPVLFHDRDFAQGREIAASTLTEISKAVGYRVPTLEEALAEFDVLWDVEVKTRDAVAATIAVLRKLATSRRFFVTSFRRDVVRRAGAALGVEHGLIVSRAPLGVARTPGSVVVWRFRLANRRRVARARALGQRVFVYGPESPLDHERCVALGVDGVITDFPELARRAAGEVPPARSRRRRGR